MWQVQGTSKKHAKPPCMEAEVEDELCGSVDAGWHEDCKEEDVNIVAGLRQMRRH